MIDTAALRTLLAAIEASGFCGDIEYDEAARMVAATDNSIYQMPPLAIFYPRSGDDINRVMRCVHQHRQHGFSLTARGGGSGTNGQSLSDNLILDCSRYLTRIGTLDEQQQTITVEPGVVLDQLNRFLQASGLFFPIDISSSSRATLGGMVATDASGKGSLIYGKTSQHIAALNVVTSDGTDFHAIATHADEGMALRPLYQEILQQQAEIERVFPVMDRGLTGYDLKHAIEPAGTFNPCYLFSGSEGTLAITKQITLRLCKRPTHKMLCVVFYDDFQRALEHVQTLLQCRPAAIEMLDDKILTLAKQDSIWQDVKATLDKLPQDASIKASNFIEFVGMSNTEIASFQLRVISVLKQTASDFRVIHFETENNPQRIASLWNLRKRAVGLLGKLADNKKGVAFVEDTAVPPQNLAAYVADFRALLDKNQLEYGMYGHADAGVLHVRPALDLMQAQQRLLIRPLSDAVARLALKHGGVLWGEHGRGFRGEYTPLFFGKKLYPLLRDIKHYFDPFNLLNPGKLVTPEPDARLTALDEVPIRAELDSHIDHQLRQQYDSALVCNGNAACVNVDVSDAMCPSYKATRNKRYAPKGRAALLREWLRLVNAQEQNDRKTAIEDSLFDSLQQCLSCKSCTHNCPLNVDIPEMKSRFFEHYYSRHSRPYHWLFSRYFESLMRIGRVSPRLSNAIINSHPGAALLQHLGHLTRLPTFSESPYRQLQNYSNKLSTSANSVILLRDNYLDSFDRSTLQAAADVLQSLGFQVLLSPIIDNGKLLHVKGYRRAFRRQARRVIAQFEQLNKSGLPLISCETVTRLMFAKEYPDSLQQRHDFNLHSIESFLLQALHDRPHSFARVDDASVTLLPHCMEQTQARQSFAQWQAIFEWLDITLRTAISGCCGMSGQFGHEVGNVELSDKIYALSWQPTIAKSSGILLASGFSCRCQGHNHQQNLLHPVVYLRSLIMQ